MAKSRYKRRSKRRGQAWGNALGGHRRQKRVGGQFASGTGPSMPKMGSAKARRASGFAKKKAKDTSARRKKNARNAVIGSVLIGAAAGGGIAAIQKNKAKNKYPDRIQLSPSFFKKVSRRHGPRPKTIPMQRPRGKTRHTGSYRGREIKWVDPANKSLKFGTLRRGKISNGSPEIWTKGIKVSGAGGRRASTVIGVSSKSVQMGAIKSKSVSALTGTKAKKAPLRSRSAAAKRAREQRAMDRMMGR